MQCPVSTYLQWLQDVDCTTQCPVCDVSVAADGPEPVRLKCLRAIALLCLVKQPIITQSMCRSRPQGMPRQAARRPPAPYGLGRLHVPSVSRKLVFVVFCSIFSLFAEVAGAAIGHGHRSHRRTYPRGLCAVCLGRTAPLPCGTPCLHFEMI